MPVLKWGLVGMVAAIFAYTGAVMLREGADFLSPFLAAIWSVTWPGQFALDFLFYLLLSGAWVAWRQGGGVAGLALGLACATMGAVVFLPWLLVVTLRAGGDPERLILGPGRAARRGTATPPAP